MCCRDDFKIVSLEEFIFFYIFSHFFSPSHPYLYRPNHPTLGLIHIHACDTCACDVPMCPPSHRPPWTRCVASRATIHPRPTRSLHPFPLSPGILLFINSHLKRGFRKGSKWGEGGDPASTVLILRPATFLAAGG